ncbi:MAG: NYN domain-containing protein [Dehalococcoidales bacterium]|nr:NYN domain-containing protein [Dehalococcoidales bacterium]
MNRVNFLIDGFNLYHSIIDLGRIHNLRVKWLNIRSMCSSFLYLIGKDARLAEIYYFSAFAHHLNDPGVIKRHQDYIECLKSTGIISEMARFKPKDVTCPLHYQMAKSAPKDIKCPLYGKFVKHEEKETDIAIAARLFEIIYNNKCDTVVLLTGDTDISPAVKTCNSLFPDKHLLFAFPFHRHNRELELLLPGSFRIHAKAYSRHLFPNPVQMPDGRKIYKPTSW